MRDPIIQTRHNRSARRPGPPDSTLRGLSRYEVVENVLAIQRGADNNRGRGRGGSGSQGERGGGRGSRGGRGVRGRAMARAARTGEIDLERRLLELSTLDVPVDVDEDSPDVQDLMNNHINNRGRPQTREVNPAFSDEFHTDLAARTAPNIQIETSDLEAIRLLSQPQQSTQRADEQMDTHEDADEAGDEAANVQLMARVKMLGSGKEQGKATDIRKVSGGRVAKASSTSKDAVTKRGRGRPKGSKNKKPQQAISSSVSSNRINAIDLLDA